MWALASLKQTGPGCRVRRAALATPRWRKASESASFSLQADFVSSSRLCVNHLGTGLPKPMQLNPYWVQRFSLVASLAQYPVYKMADFCSIYFCIYFNYCNAHFLDHAEPYHCDYVLTCNMGVCLRNYSVITCCETNIVRLVSFSRASLLLFFISFCRCFVYTDYSSCLTVAMEVFNISFIWFPTNLVSVWVRPAYHFAIIMMDVLLLQRLFRHSNCLSVYHCISAL